MEGIKCPACLGQQTKELFKTEDIFQLTKQGISIRKCPECGVAFTWPFLNPERTQISTEHLSKNLIVEENIFIKLIKKIYKRYLQNKYESDTKQLLKIAGKNGKILDVGAGTGLRLKTFQQAGFECYGIEPFADTLEELPIEKTTLAKYNGEKNFFDIVTLYHVFEHFDKPVEYLNILKRFLKPGGWLVIQVPNFDSWQAKLFRGRWNGLGLPGHYFHYTPPAL